MGTIAVSALYGGIGDSIQGTELLGRIDQAGDVSFDYIIGSGEFMETVMDDACLDIDTIPVRGPLSRLLFEVRTMWRLLRHPRPEAVMLRFRTLGFGPFLYSKLKGVPLILHLDGFPSLEYSGTFVNDLALRMSKPMDKAVISGASIILLPSSVAGLGIHRCYDLTDPPRTVVVPNGADLERFIPMDRDSCRKELGLPDGKIVLFFGALEGWQGIDELRTAIRSLVERYPDVHLVVVGGGSLTERLSRCPDLDLRGLVPSSDVPKYINAADVTVAPIPTDRLAFPMKVFESLACGTPVVVTRNMSTQELTAAVPELLIDDNDPGTIADRLESILFNSDGSEIGDRGRSYILSRYGWDQAADRLAQELDRLSREGPIRKRGPIRGRLRRHPAGDPSADRARTSPIRVRARGHRGPSPWHVR